MAYCSQTMENSKCSVWAENLYPDQFWMEITNIEVSSGKMNIGHLVGYGTEITTPTLILTV